MHIDQSGDIVDITIIMKLIDVKTSFYIDFDVVSNDKDPKFKVGGHVKISNTFVKVCTPNWSEEVLFLKKLKILHHGHMLLVISTVKKLLELFMKKRSKRQIKQSLELEK